MMGSRWVSKKIPVLSFSVQAFCWKASNSRRGTRRVVVDLCGRLCLVTYTFSRLHRFSSIPFLLLPSCSRPLSSSVKFRTASRFHRKKRSVVTVARVLNYTNSYVGEIVARSTVYRDKKTRVSSQIPPLVSRANRICPRPCFFSCVHRNRRVQGSVGSIICQLVPRFNAYFDELDV